MTNYDVPAEHREPKAWSGWVENARYGYRTLYVKGVPVRCQRLSDAR